MLRSNPRIMLTSKWACACGAQRTVEDPLVAEAVPEFAFQPADRDQVLRGAGVLVRHAGQRRQRACGQVAEAGSPR